MRCGATINNGSAKYKMSEDTILLELALREMSLALDALAEECTDADGKPKAPSHKSLMRSRGLLPPYCEQSLSRKNDHEA